MRRHRPVPRPGSHRVDLLLHHHRQRAGGAEFGEEDLLIDLAIPTEGRIEAGHDGLLDLGAGEAFAGVGQRAGVECLDGNAAFFQVDGEDVGARGAVRQIDKKDLIQPSLAHQLGR